MHQSLRFIACRLNTAQHVVAVLLVVVGPTGPTTTNSTATTTFQR